MYIINAGGDQIGGKAGSSSGGGGDTIVNINYSGAASWGEVASNGGKISGLNCTSSRTGIEYTIVFNTPMPNDNYAVTLGGTATESRAINKTANGFDVRTFVSDGSADDYSFDFAVHALNALPPMGGTGADCWVNFDGRSSVGTDCTICSSFNFL